MAFLGTQNYLLFSAGGFFQVQIKTRDFGVSILVKKYELTVLFGNQKMGFDSESDAVLEVFFVNCDFEIMNQISLVLGKVSLVGLVGDAKSLEFTKYHHGALHEVYHYVLQLWHKFCLFLVVLVKRVK